VGAFGKLNVEGASSPHIADGLAVGSDLRPPTDASLLPSPGRVNASQAFTPLPTNGRGSSRI
jgi:hypothetical protein